MKLYQINHQKNKQYHPQGNGKVEVSNKEIENIFTMTIEFHHHDWDKMFLNFFGIIIPLEKHQQDSPSFMEKQLFCQMILVLELFDQL